MILTKCRRSIPCRSNTINFGSNAKTRIKNRKWSTGLIGNEKIKIKTRFLRSHVPKWDGLGGLRNGVRPWTKFRSSKLLPVSVLDRFFLSLSLSFSVSRRRDVLLALGPPSWPIWSVRNGEWSGSVWMCSFQSFRTSFTVRNVFQATERALHGKKKVFGQKEKSWNEMKKKLSKASTFFLFGGHGFIELVRQDFILSRHNRVVF